MAEWSVFRIVVTAIVAMALIALIGLYFGPMFQAPDSLLRQLNDSLETAQGMPGKAVALDAISLQEGVSFKSAQFSKNDRIVVFECNDGSVCCAAGSKECENGMLWNSNSVIAQKRLFTQAAARCREEQTVYVCTLYFGKQPAQLKVKEMKFKQTVDLALPNDSIVDVSIQNVGESGSVNPITAVAKLVELQTNAQGVVERIPIASIAGIQTISTLSVQATKMISLSPDIREAGSYELEIKIQGEDAGSETRTIAFNANGTYQSPCQATDQADLPQWIDSTCKERHYCVPQKCSLPSECKNAWASKEPGDWSAGTVEYAYKILSNVQCNQ